MGELYQSHNKGKVGALSPSALHGGKLHQSQRKMARMGLSLHVLLNEAQLKELWLSQQFTQQTSHKQLLWAKGQP